MNNRNRPRMDHVNTSPFMDSILDEAKKMNVFVLDVSHAGKSLLLQTIINQKLRHMPLDSTEE
ncbi:hypothetical protein P9A10_25455 [Serratia marcescens]|uniref:hypothetical protein n=1 Tax=Serratia marcescens TaxID=615 RepID=UPI0032046592